MVQGIVLIAFTYFFDRMTLEDEFSSDEVEPETEIRVGASGATIVPPSDHQESGTYIKLSREEDCSILQSELKMMDEKFLSALLIWFLSCL